SVLGAFIGCHHVAGVCDCQPDTYCGCHCAHIAANSGPMITTAPFVGPTATPADLPKTTPPGGEPKVLPTPPDTPSATAPKLNYHRSAASVGPCRLRLGIGYAKPRAANKDTRHALKFSSK